MQTVTVRELHDRAMELADAKRFVDAFDFEARAAVRACDLDVSVATRYVLLRSAANLALAAVAEFERSAGGREKVATLQQLMERDEPLTPTQWQFIENYHDVLHDLAKRQIAREGAKPSVLGTVRRMEEITAKVFANGETAEQASEALWKLE